MSVLDNIFQVQIFLTKKRMISETDVKQHGINSQTVPSSSFSADTVQGLRENWSWQTCCTHFSITSINIYMFESQCSGKGQMILQSAQDNSKETSITWTSATKTAAQYKIYHQQLAAQLKEQHCTANNSHTTLNITYTDSTLKITEHHLHWQYTEDTTCTNRQN